MTFNWPDIPFSGTEVDAFVVEYKALAQTIYDTWFDEIGNTFDAKPEVNVEALLAPYQSRENVKMYLENALLYSAFVVKQRAGNSGPGTDFDLGNSPIPTGLSSTQAKALFGRLGCNFENVHLCYEGGDGDGGPKFNNIPPGAENFANSSGPGSASPGQNNPANAGKPPPPKYPPDEPNKCPGGSNNDGNNGDINNGQGLSPTKIGWIAVLSTIKNISYIIGNAGWYHSADMLLHFLDGTGAMYTAPNGRMKNLLRIEVHNHLKAGSSPGSFFNNKFINIWSAGYNNLIRGPYVEYSEAARATLGLSSSQKIWRVNFGGSDMNGAFGRALIVSDGTETIDRPFAPPGADPNDTRYWVPRDASGAINVNKVTHILDDYDFEYSWSIVRSSIGNDFPGVKTPDDIQIQSGKGFCGADGNKNRTVCGAITSQGSYGKDYMQRLPVAEAHGDGCKDYDPDLAASKGKPYTVRITF